ncbi:hypothetical protein L3V82_03985 [Thiotrichales bacterium 19S3-7]|nr:hypothetical protein [Thiotrichales bacterium 19S3-7]MCF6801834.1 hypothetical protein [Thiotrichales bacterium 19S3-11]
MPGILETIRNLAMNDNYGDNQVREIIKIANDILNSNENLNDLYCPISLQRLDGDIIHIQGEHQSYHAHALTPIFWNNYDPRSPMTRSPIALNQLIGGYSNETMGVIRQLYDSSLERFNEGYIIGRNEQHQTPKNPSLIIKKGTQQANFIEIEPKK